jgi:hypothetical protein
MPVLSHEELQSIIQISQAPAVSIFVPTHRAGPEIQQDPIRLKNLLRTAEDQLVQEGVRPADARELLAPITDLLGDAHFWRHQGDGLAIFRSHDVFRLYRLPLHLQEFVTVSDRFYVKPLLPLLVNDARFYLLALSQNEVRLLECSRDRVHEIELPDAPEDMADTMKEEPERQLQFHSQPLDGRSWQARFHGHGVGADDVDVVNLTRYFHRLEDSLSNVLKETRAPLILSCVEYLAPIFREVSAYRPILEPIVAGNPDGLTNEELHRKGWLIAEPYFRQAQEQAAAEFHEGLAKGRAGNTLNEVLTAAFQGRIATLFVPVGLHRWGHFRFDELALEEHDQEQPGDDELLDLAAMQTILHGGTVYSVSPDTMPGQQLLAAVYRF